MNKTESILKPFANVQGGAYLPHNKNTKDLETKVIAAPKFVKIPMVQHIGAPCEVKVAVGDKVYIGTKIGDSNAFVSAPIHSSISGTVTAINKERIANGSLCEVVVIENDFENKTDPNIKPVDINTAQDLVNAARECGLVGLGGAGFPTYIKLKADENKPIDTLIINGAECEPYITADYRECIENPDDILFGIYFIKNILNIKNVIIAIEDNKPKAIDLLYKIAADKQDINDEVKLMKLKSRYPQGAEKVLVYTACKRKIPLGKLPADVGCIVLNITSIGVLARYIKTGMPLTHKRITVDGNAIEKTGNYLCPIGMSIADILDNLGMKDAEKILLGGPMMGNAISDLSVPLVKQNNAILCFKGKESLAFEPTNCINCARCMNACPMNLAPRGIEVAIEFKATAEELKQKGAEYCIECGSCAFSCPARRSLVQAMRLAKAEIRKAGNK